MTPHKQLHRHRPDEGAIGDCWRTAIACLLDLPPDHVPHFMAPHWSADNGNAANADTRTWLRDCHALSFIEYAMDGSFTLDAVLRSVGVCNPGMFYLLSGTSRTGCGHTVICCDGNIVWDPSQDDAGIVGAMSDGFYWVAWLVTSRLVRVAEVEAVS